ADTRRGRPTVHRRWNTETAILSGDAMLTLATMLVAKGANMGVLDKFNQMAMDVYKGQQYDMDFEQRRDVTVDEYLHMISLKTAALISGACAIGAMMAGTSAAVVDAFSAYGYNLGMAFQLQDDYLDTYGDPEKFGKAIGGDIVNDKKTWLQIMALTEDHTGETSSLIAGAVPSDVKVDRMRRIYDRLELPERCHKLIDQYIRQAVDAISGIDIDEASRDFFKKMARQLATRNI
ncbi:MAG: polyprenyl synthetase family protein, partial [Muribaculaceae bacterium]|nr:polyprenyl synthetase family protein [Muribaculaceae bacterium]